MAVGSLYTAKDNRSGYQPLVLVSIAWADGTVLRYSTHDLTGARAFGGYDWEARILNGPMAAQQAISEGGVDIPPTMDITLSDPDGEVWTVVMAKGLLGATVTATVLLLDVATGTFSTDTYTPFVGRGNPPTTVDSETLTFTAESKLSMQRKFLPTAQIQRYCLWDFPSTAQERDIAAGPSDGSGICRCGYSYGSGGGIGNADPSTGAAFVKCGKSYGDCMARMGNGSRIDLDNAGHHTGTFSGIRFDPKSHYWSRGYVSGAWEFGTNSLNLGKYSQPVPLAYGLVRAAPPTTVVTTGDSNLTANEALLSLDQIGPIQEVVMNDVNIFESGAGGTVIAGFWNLVNDGSKLGQANSDTLFDRMGDPYGSMAAIHVRVPKSLQDSSSAGNLQVLFYGRKVRQYAPGAPISITGVTYGPTTIQAVGHGLVSGDIAQVSGCNGDAGLNRQVVVTVTDADHFRVQASVLRLGTWTSGGTVYRWIPSTQYSSNNAWVLMDLLWWTDIDYEEQDILAAYTESLYCDHQIPYTDVWGSASTHARFSCSLYINQKRGAGELIRAFRLGWRCMLQPSVDGLLRMAIEKTLAEQQPGPVLGSNYNAALPSVLADGTPANGYIAYDFNDSNILNKDGKVDGPPSLRIFGSRRQEMPNKLSAPIQDIENRNSIDAYTVNCVQASDEMGEEVATQFGAEGINTYDQAQRMFGLQFAKTFLGNYTPGYTGSLFVEWQAGPWALHLKIGDIVRLASPNKAVPPTLLRITQKKPDTNFRTITLTGRFHSDTWYRDDYEQNPGKTPSTLANAALLRPPFAWRGGYITPAAGDPMYDAGEGFFDFALAYGSDAAGSPTPVLTISGLAPVNLFSSLTQPPWTPLQGTTSDTGGFIPGGITLYMALAAKDAIGSPYKLTQLSQLVQVVIPAGTNTNTASFTDAHYMPGTVGRVIFAGTDPSALSVQQIVDSVVSPVNTITSLSIYAGAPDVQADHLLAQVWRVSHSGPVGTSLTAVTATTLQVAGILWTVNQWAGYDVSVVGFINDPASVPIANYHVLSNTSDTLTLSGSGPSPLAAGVQAGDALVIRSKPNSWGADYYTDPGWNNSTAFSLQIALLAAASGGHIVVNWVAHGALTGANVRLDNAADITGIWPITVIDADHFSITPATTTYVSGGFAAILTGGLVPGIEKGNLLVAIAGTGRGMWNRIRDNSADTVYIEGVFAVQPDSSTRFIILLPTPVEEKPTAHLDATLLNTAAVITIPVPNDKDETLAVTVTVVSSDGKESFRHLAQVREIYSYGGPGGPTLGNPGYVTLTPDLSNNVQIDLGALAGVTNFRLFLSGTAVTFLPPIFTGGTLTNQSIGVYLVQPNPGDKLIPSFSNGAGGFASNTQASIVMDGTADTMTALVFTLHPGNVWILDSQGTGNTIS